VYMDFMIMAVDNVDEVVLGANPNFTEYGPYSYLETRIKEDIKAVGGDKIR
jgi:hypothetical protein